MTIKYKFYYAEANYGQSEINAVLKVLRNQKHHLMGGKQTLKLEKEVSNLFGKKYGLMTNSGSSSNLLAINSFHFKKGSEIITPALTFSTTVSPIVHNGLVPAFVDININTLQIDTQLVENAVNNKTVAIMVPNLIGNIADWKKLRLIANKHKLKLIEDSADTIGYNYKLKDKYKKSDVCTTSFYASHIITGAGFGGMVCFNDYNNFKYARSLRNWGRRSVNYGETENYIRRFDNTIGGIRYDDKYIFDDLGYNFMGSDISAAFALSKLKNLKKNIKKRRENFDKLKVLFQNFDKYIKTFETTQGYETGWLAFPIMVKKYKHFNNRTDLQIKLEKSGIQTRTIFTGNITRHPVAKKFKWSVYGNLNNSNKIMRSGILLGCHELITDKHINYLKEKLGEFFA